MKHLKSLPNLTYLNLYGTKVTDAGLEHLKALPKLQRLYVWQTEVTDEGAANLAKALPQLEISRGWELKLASKDSEKETEKKDEKKDEKK